MVEAFYSFLEGIGYTHPVHPVLTHAPMGMVIGMLIFGLLALRWKNYHFSEAAYYCSVVALIAIFPTAFFGLFDWQRFLEGAWYPLIIVKMSLTTVLIFLLIIAIVMRNKGASPTKLAIVYVLCMACAGGIGYAGGDLVYG